MPNTFLVKAHRSIGTSNTTVNGYVVAAATTSTVIGMSLCNITGNTINVNVMHNDGSSNTYICKSVPILSGATLVAIGGEEKVVLQTGHSIQVSSDTATSVDALMSVLEIS
jgi:hypothetical protein